jgi:phage FluMu gp28-like protein
MNYTEQIARIKQLSQLFEVKYAAVDQTGVGEAVLEILKQTLPYTEGVIFTRDTKVQLTTSLRLSLEKKKLALPNDPKLIMQMNSLRYTFSISGNLLYRPPESEKIHDDYLWALALAVYAAERWIPTYKAVGVKKKW